MGVVVDEHGTANDRSALTGQLCFPMGNIGLFIRGAIICVAADQCYRTAETSPQRADFTMRRDDILRSWGNRYNRHAYRSFYSLIICIGYPTILTFAWCIWENYSRKDGFSIPSRSSIFDQISVTERPSHSNIRSIVCYWTTQLYDKHCSNTQ